MIAKQELEQIFELYGIPTEIADIIDRNERIFKEADIETICLNIEIFFNKGIAVDKIAKHPSILNIKDFYKIEEIFKIFEKYNISKDTIERSLNIFIKEDAKEIERFFEIFETNNITKESMEKCLILIANGKKNDVEEIFEKNSLLETLETYMKARGFYNKFITKEEFEEISKEKNLTVDEIIKYYFPYIHDTIRETLEKKGKIYIGESIKMQEEDLQKNSELILSIAKRVSKWTQYMYSYKDTAEMESYGVSVMMEKCGDIAFNLENSPELLKRSMTSKVKKYCRGKIFSESSKSSNRRKNIGYAMDEQEER